MGEGAEVRFAMLIALYLIVLLPATAHTQDVRYLHPVTIALQFEDFRTTRAALKLRAEEANPLMRWCAPRTPCLVTVKSFAAVSIVLAGESLRAQGHTRGAFWFTVFLNGVQTVVNVNNYYTLSKLRERRRVVVTVPISF